MFLKPQKWHLCGAGRVFEQLGIISFYVIVMGFPKDYL
jgi:hypothetical protein